MNFKVKKPLLVSVITLAVLYVLFLALPLVVTSFIKGYNSQIVQIVKDTTGMDLTLDKLSFTTSWNFRVGVKAKKMSLSIPSDDIKIVEAENFGGNLSLIPLLTRKIQLGNLYAKNLKVNVKIKDDGNVLLMDYLPKSDEPSEPFVMPLGLKLSNKLPNISIGKYNVAVLDMKSGKKYYTDGENLCVSDFILDKKVKLKTKGRVVFDEQVISNYDVKVFNKIMPNLSLHELVFPETAVITEVETEPQAEQQELPFDIIQVLQSTVDNKVRADLKTDIKVSGNLKNPILNGYFDVSGITVAVDGQSLPEGYVNLKFKGDNTNIDSILYTSSDKKETTQIIGSVKTGKKPSIDMTFRSNAKFNNIINLADSIAQSFNINDLATLSATGGIDADFNISSDLKKVDSNGYLKILPSRISYGLYNVSIEDITADINFDNGIDIKKSGFSIFNHPLSLVGYIKQDSTTDLKLTADKLSVKGLLATLGQISLLKENEISSGVISLNALIKGNLAQLKPELVSTLDNLKLVNKPSSTTVNLDQLVVNAKYDGKTILGDIDVKDFLAQNGAIIVKVPDTCVLMDANNIKLNKAYLLLNNSKFDITGGVKDYTTDKLAINLSAKGNLQSADVAAFLPNEFVSLISYKGQMPLDITVTGNSKVQDINVNLDADVNNYIALIDIDKLKNKSAKIKSNLEIIGDSIQLRNTGIYEGSNAIATASGEITRLYSAPKLNISVSVPNPVSFPIWGVANSNISAVGSINVGGTVDRPTVSGTVRVPDISMKDFDFAITDLVADLSGAILHGNATVKQLKAGGIIATDLAGKFSLKDYNLFTVTDVVGKAFDGNVKGKLSYEINSTKVGLDFAGTGLNSSKAVYGAAGIKDALTGILNFTAKLTMQGVTDVEMINSMKGDIKFDIEDGKFVNIGRIENLIAAQNISSNSVLKTAISSLSGLSAIQEADKFKSITGEISLSKGNANLNKILVSGPLMSYYVSGSYNILQNTANIIILGRLESKVVSLLGVVGDLSVDKLLSSIPKLGTMTSSVWKQLTTDPVVEDTSLIPVLSSGSTTYKDFKVSHNGVVGAASSVKYFKWLASTVETKDIDVKQDLQNAKDAVKENIKTKVEKAKTDAATVKSNVNTIVETQKNKVQTIKDTVQQTKQDFQTVKTNAKPAATNVKNLMQNALKNSVSRPAPTTTTTEQVPVESAAP